MLLAKLPPLKANGLIDDDVENLDIGIYIETKTSFDGDDDDKYEMFVDIDDLEQHVISNFNTKVYKIQKLGEYIQVYPRRISIEHLEQLTPEEVCHLECSHFHYPDIKQEMNQHGYYRNIHGYIVYDPDKAKKLSNRNTTKKIPGYRVFTEHLDKTTTKVLTKCFGATKYQLSYLLHEDLAWDAGQHGLRVLRANRTIEMLDKMGRSNLIKMYNTSVKLYQQHQASADKYTDDTWKANVNKFFTNNLSPLTNNNK